MIHHNISPLLCTILLLCSAQQSLWSATGKPKEAKGKTSLTTDQIALRAAIWKAPIKEYKISASTTATGCTAYGCYPSGEYNGGLMVCFFQDGSTVVKSYHRGSDGSKSASDVSREDPVKAQFIIQCVKEALSMQGATGLL